MRKKLEAMDLGQLRDLRMRVSGVAVKFKNDERPKARKVWAALLIIDDVIRQKASAQAPPTDMETVLDEMVSEISELERV